jgi:hypothetical protein
VSTAPRRKSAPRPSDATPPPRDAAKARFWPTLAELTDWRGPFLIPLLLLVFARALAWSRIPVAAEDAYITFRYARNLGVGNGLVFNPDERVMGFSSALWTLWNGLGYAITQDPVTWSRAWSVLADVVTLITLGLLAARHASRASAWALTFFFAAWPYFSALAVSGMENSLMVCLIAVAAAAVGARSPAAGPALAALAWIRPEGLASAAVIALGARARDRLVALGLAALAYGAVALYFGTVVPQSVIAKANVYGTPGPWIGGRVWWEWISPVMFGRFPVVGDTSAFIVLTVVVAPSFVLGVRALWRQRTSPLALAAGAALAVWLGYIGVGVTYFWWYLAAPLIGIMTAAAVGFPQVVRGRGVAIACALYVVSVWSISHHLYLGRAIGEARSFGVAADYLAAHARPGEKLMLEPIGFIGYTTPLVVIDEVGLVSPKVARRRMGGPGWYTDIVNEERPQWLVLREGVLRTGTSFAGAGAPFRSEAERNRLLADYSKPRPRDLDARDADLVILRRND